MKFFVIVAAALCSTLYCSAADKISHYKNDEKHIAKELDVNNVPIDPACKFRTVWSNVRMNGVTRAEIPTSELKHITIVKFHYAGAWIAWTDEQGYHEPSPDIYVPWSNFPDEIKNYYKPYYLEDWDGLKSKKAFFMRTSQIDPKAKKYKQKRGNLILRRATSGVLCRSLFNNVFIPYSELPLEIRTKCGFYENESYIPAMPVLNKKISGIKDKILYIPANGFRILRRFREGDVVRVVPDINSPRKYHDIFIKKYRGRMVPNHKSDLHIFQETIFEKACTKCKLSDHLNEKFFNFMFDRQSRTPCPVATNEYALVKVGTQKYGKRLLTSYQYLPDFDKKYPRDSVLMLGKIKIPKRMAKEETAEEMPTDIGL